MNLVFWPNSTFLHCSYLTLFTPQFFYIIIDFIVSRVLQSSQEKLNQKKIPTHFSSSFFFLEGDEVGGEKGVLQWWIVEKKKASLLG